MDQNKARGGNEYSVALFEQLKSLKNQKVKLYLKPGASKYGNILIGRLNHVGDSNAVTGKPWVIIDFGESESFDIDKIVKVEPEN